jgi:ubiquitin-protein ligase
MSRESRIEQERQEFIEWKNSISCEGDPQKGNSVWNLIMNGPGDSPYMGGKFKIRITFPDGYPSSKPEFEFLTPICHININGTHICIDSLNNYNSSYSITDILSQIFMILTCPNENSPYQKYIDLYKNDYSGYLAKAREMTREYAK